MAIGWRRRSDGAVIKWSGDRRGGDWTGWHEGWQSDRAARTAAIEQCQSDGAAIERGSNRTAATARMAVIGWGNDRMVAKYPKYSPKPVSSPKWGSQKLHKIHANFSTLIRKSGSGSHCSRYIAVVHVSATTRSIRAATDQLPLAVLYHPCCSHASSDHRLIRLAPSNHRLCCPIQSPPSMPSRLSGW